MLSLALLSATEPALQPGNGSGKNQFLGPQAPARDEHCAFHQGGAQHQEARRHHNLSPCNHGPPHVARTHPDHAPGALARRRGGHLVDCDWRLQFYLGLGPPTKMNKKTHGKTHHVPDEAIGWAVGSKKRSTEEYRETEATRKMANLRQLTEARKARSQKAGRSARAQRTSTRVGGV